MPLYGPAAGVQAALGSAEQLSNLALFPARAQLARAQAGLAQEKLQEMQAQRAALQEWGTEASAPGAPGTPPQSMAAKLYRLAQLEFAKGAPTPGMQLLKEADMMQLHESTIQKNQSTIELNKLKQDQAEAAWAAQRFAAIDPKSPDAPAEYARVNTDYMAMFKKPSPLANVPYSPKLLQSLVKAGMSAKDQLLLQIRQKDEAMKRENLTNLETYRQNRIKAEKSRTRAYKDHLKFIEKNGGRTPVATNTDITNARQLIMQSFPGADTTSPDVYNESVAIANLAREKMARNRALTYSQAMAQAFDEKRREDNWDVQPPGFFGTSSKLHVTTGMSPETAMPLPAKRSDWHVGRWYVGHDAQGNQVTGMWTGKGFKTEAPATGTGSSAGGGLPPSGDERGDSSADDEGY